MNKVIFSLGLVLAACSTVGEPSPVASSGLRVGATARAHSNRVRPDTSNTPADVDRHHHEATLPPNPVVALLPEDLSSDVGTRPVLEAIVQVVTTQVSAQLAEQVAQTIQLYRISDRQLIRTSRSTQTLELPNSGMSHILITVDPGSELADTWYQLEISRLPVNVEVLPSTRVVSLSSGKVLARFRPGSDPVLRSVRICGPRDNRNRVYFDYSERVELPVATPPPGLDVAGVPVGCSLVAPPSTERGATLATLSCPTDVNFANARIRVVAGARGIGGAMENLSDHQSWRDAPRWTPFGVGCTITRNPALLHVGLVE